jgi:ketosteroid isomerase-like protein
MNEEQTLRAMYAAFDARDADAVLAHMTADVDWPNAWEGGRVQGQEAVRTYWTRQWAEIEPTVDPVSFTQLPDGAIAVGVHQVVRAKGGDVLADDHVVHTYHFRDGLIAQMDVGY